MTTIQGLSPAAAPRRRGRAAGASGGFNIAEDAQTSAAETAASTEVGWVGMLALQEAVGDVVQDREAKRHGQDMLAELAGLQRELLAEGVDPERLRRLADMADAVPTASDPRLRAVVGAVAMRVRIELARREIAGTQSNK